MQTVQRFSLLKQNIKKFNFYKNKISQFASDWTSNSMTGEVSARHVNTSYSNLNSFTFINRPGVRCRQRVVHNHKPNSQEKSDFPQLAKQIQFLSGGNKKI